MVCFYCNKQTTLFDSVVLDKKYNLYCSIKCRDSKDTDDKIMQISTLLFHLKEINIKIPIPLILMIAKNMDLNIDYKTKNIIY